MTIYNSENSVYNIQITENVLSKKEHDILINFVISTDSWYTQPWGVKICETTTMPEQVIDVLEKVFRIIQQKCEDIYNAKLRVFERREVHLVKFEQGYKMNRHVDTTGDFAAIYYINDDYDGGEINFPNHNLKIKPKSNSFITFPSNEHYVHEVLENTKKERYSSTLWFNFEGSEYRGSINQYKPPTDTIR